MLNPAVASILTFYYPVGNTPAVSWTQDLPSGKKASVLSLGCGDVRSILFTSHCVDDGGKLDITCCDFESTVIARNILFLSLILDDNDSAHLKRMWDIYYHIRIDRKALKLLETQAHRLGKLADSLTSWHNGPYGESLRICDTSTLLQIRTAWRAFATSVPEASDESRFEKNMRRAKDVRKTFIGEDTLVLTGNRSVAPLLVEGLQDLPAIHSQFWDNGTTDSTSMVPQGAILNPTFVSHSPSASCLHYGTDPLLGFHLAAAYAPLVSDRRSRLHASLATTTSEAVREARMQLQEWALSFRRAVDQGLILRFYVGEALALCHVLNAKKADRKAQPRIYRAQNSFETVSLDSEDYDLSGTAPLAFDIIDTSNLMDHVGPISLLVATAPLLSENPHAVLHTEILVKREASHKDLAGSLLNGNFPTMSTLMGLFPVEYWTNSTVASSASEILSASVLGTKAIEGRASQMYAKLTWKRSIPPPTPGIRYNENDLAHILCSVYRDMFEHLEPRRLLNKLSLQTLRNVSCPRYHHGSFAMLLHFIWSSCVVQDWDKMMGLLLNHLSSPTELLSVQELHAQLHISGVYRYTPEISRPMTWPRFSSNGKGLAAWKDVPDTVCITFNVPRKDLDVLTKAIGDQPGSPMLQCQLRGPGDKFQSWLNVFEVIHYTFGKVSTSGAPYSNSFQVYVSEDTEGWLGHAPMVVSFRVPTWAIIAESQTAFVTLNVQNIPANVRFLRDLGIEMKLSETTLRDEQNVFLTLGLPNRAEDVGSIVRSSYLRQTQPSGDGGIRGSVEAVRETGQDKITGFTTRLDIESEKDKIILRDTKAEVQTRQSSPFSVTVTIGTDASSHQIWFPSPVSLNKSKTKVARKSSYVEVTVPVADPAAGRGLQFFMFPLSPASTTPVLWNMPRVALDKLLVLDLSKKKKMEWLVTHCSMTFSSRERRLRDPANALTGDVRIDFKDSLLSLFLRFCGQQGQKARIFGLNNPTRGGVHVLLFPSCLRLDPANRTVVLDCAILALTDGITQKLRSFLAAISDLQLCSIKVNDEELDLWKRTVPAFVDRCRDWDHRADCEYAAKDQIPLSTKYGETPLCGCGTNTIPKNYLIGIPEWESARRYAVRAAISPVFASPFVEDTCPEPSHLINPTSPPRTIDPNRCHTCRKPRSENGASLLSCARCKETKYCSAACQKADWKSHKQHCSK